MSNDTGMRTIAKKIYIYNGMFNCFGDHENTKPFYSFSIAIAKRFRAHTHAAKATTNNQL